MIEDFIHALLNANLNESELDRFEDLACDLYINAEIYQTDEGAYGDHLEDLVMMDLADELGREVSFNGVTFIR